MNDDDKIIICSGKAASLAIETAMIPLDKGHGPREVKEGLRDAALSSKLRHAKLLVDEVVAEVVG